MSIADELVLLANTKEGLRVSLGLSEDVPFSQYAAYVAWHNASVPDSHGFLDFQNKRYSVSGTPCYLSDISYFYRLSSATMWVDGQLVGVGVDVPRISGEGLLIEPSRTNELPYSSDFSQGWGTNEVVLTPNAAVAPDGTVSASKLTATATGSPITHGISRPLLMNRTFSLFAKAGEFSKLRIQGSNSSGNGGGTVEFDLLNGTIITDTTLNLSGEITPADDGWYRCSVYFTNDFYTNQTYFIRLLDNAGGVLFTGDGTSGIYIWGAQFEKGSVATSYIPTHGTPATRTPDILNIPLLPSQTPTGDWDAGVTYEDVDNIATFTGHGYIRNIAVEAL